MDYGRSWSSQEWKSEATAHGRSGKPDEISWNAMQQVRPHHEEPLIDGNAQSVRYGELIHDGSLQPDDVNSQQEANSQNFIMGSDATEFVNQVRDQVRIRQKRMSNVAGEGEEHSIIWVNVYGCDDECSDIHGEEFPKQSEFHYEYIRSHTEENIRHLREIGERTGRD